MRALRAILGAAFCVMLVSVLSACGDEDNNDNCGCNSAPVANAGPDRTVKTGRVAILDGSGSTDADGDTLSYRWSFQSLPGASKLADDALTGADTAAPAFMPDADGIYVLALTVNDGTADSAVDTAVITAIALFAPIPDTGQNECYDMSGTVISCTGGGLDGQDGNYSIHPMFFTDNSDGTVTDNVTGLMWQRNEGTANWYEASGTADSTYNPGGAIDVCGDLAVGGHTDWRLPTEGELMSIVNYGTHTPAIDGTYFPGTNTSGYYWASADFVQLPTYAWRASYTYGHVTVYIKTTDYFVRCVRGSRATPSFTDNGDGTVTDNNTGLMWQQGDGGTKNLQAALSYCEGLAFAGYEDWRLPNIKELRSIVDNTAYGPAIDGTYFPNVDPSSYYWSSTSHDFIAGSAWYTNFVVGSVDVTSKWFLHYTRCVR